MTYGEKILDKITEKRGNETRLAFLPYKYSMWDSMETVYDAAIDRGMKPIICPIEYLTKGDSKWHDESVIFNQMGYETSKDITKANLLVIHYPYDGNNKVTCINPQFYSRELKAAGYKLVYLAYCGSMFGKNFILQPGVRNANYIFTDTEEERQVYINTWKIYRNIDISTRVHCVGGLPKYEAVNKHRESPACFKPINKHIVLLCGGLTSLLNDPRRIDKWREVVDKFADMDECELIFRPHPLTMDMLNAMQPKRRDDYLDFLEEIRRRAVLDDSPNDQMSLRYATYLVSDPSSMIDMWKRTGKDYEVIE